MGHLLSHPITSKYVQTCGNAYFRCGVAEMQGYRTNMEDTHNTILSLKHWKANRQKQSSAAKGGTGNSSGDHSNNHAPNPPSDPSDVAFFGVYDGHSGPAAAEFACVDLPTRVSELPDPFDKAAVTQARTRQRRGVLQEHAGASARLHGVLRHRPAHRQQRRVCRQPLPRADCQLGRQSLCHHRCGRPHPLRHIRSQAGG